MTTMTDVRPIFENEQWLVTEDGLEHKTTGYFIERESLVGAGALVTEGKAFEPRSLIVGAPAKAVRSLDDAAVERLRKSAVHYADNAARFARGLSPQETD